MSDHKKHSSDSPSFAELLDGVKQISKHDKVVHDTPKPRPIPKQSQRDERKVMQELLVSPSEHEDMQWHAEHTANLTEYHDIPTG